MAVLTLSALAILAPAVDLRAGDLATDYLHRVHELVPRDVDGRIALAEWCGQQGLRQQQVDLLAEAVKIQPDHAEAYRLLLGADERFVRPVDRQWAQKVQQLLGPPFRLHHAGHFTLLTDADEDAARMQADALEETYRTFFRACSALGLRPMPPQNRLLCVQFQRFDEYRDFLERFEGATHAWAAGFYSVRTNRVVFYDDGDNPVLKFARDQLSATEKQIAALRGEMEGLTGTARRLSAQEKLRHLNAQRQDIALRLEAVARASTLAKTRHEATHQLFYNSGLMKRGKPWPFWYSEGLATNFEADDGQGRAGPTVINQNRLKSLREAIAEGRAMRLSNLLTYEPGRDDTVEHVVAAYSHAWTLVHYLWNRQPREMAAFMQDVAAHPPAADGFTAVFTKHFGEDLPAIERQVTAFADGLR